MQEREPELQVKKCYVMGLMTEIDLHQKIEGVGKVDLAEVARQFA